MNDSQSYRAFAFESRLTPEIRDALLASGRADLAKLFESAETGNESPYHAAVVRAARRQVERSDSVSFPDEGIVIPGEFQGERLVLSWVCVNLAKLSESLMAQANQVEIPVGIDLWASRRLRGQFILAHYPFTHELLGNSDWVEDRHNHSLAVTIWGKDPDRPDHQSKNLFVILFEPDTCVVKTAQLI